MGNHMFVISMDGLFQKEGDVINKR